MSRHTAGALAAAALACPQFFAPATAVAQSSCGGDIVLLGDETFIVDRPTIAETLDEARYCD